MCTFLVYSFWFVRFHSTEEFKILDFIIYFTNFITPKYCNMSCFFSLIFIFLSTVNEKDSFWITLTYFTFFVPILCPSGYSSELDTVKIKIQTVF